MQGASIQEELVEHSREDEVHLIALGNHEVWFELGRHTCKWAIKFWNIIM